MANAFAAGASASLNKTITAMEKFLEEEQKRASGGLRDCLLARLGDLAVGIAVGSTADTAKATSREERERYRGLSPTKQGGSFSAATSGRFTSNRH